MQSSYRSIFRPDLFLGQCMLVTGAGSGIGRCIAHELAALGAHVVLAGRKQENLEKVCHEISDATGSADFVQMNIRDEDQVEAAIAEVIRRHGRIDGLVNNAGGQFASPAALIRPKGWRAVIDTNLNGTFFVCQSVFRLCMADHGGAMVTIVADMWNGFPGMAHTGAARAGVVNLMQTLALEWASAGVRVNAVAPGYVLSSGLHNYPEGILDLAATVMTQNPSSRLGTESEVSSAVAFLLSPGAAFITGATLRVDGAASLQKAPMLPLAEHDKLTPYHGFHLAADVPDRFKK